ncbi:FUSC family protein [Nocardioides koreensis]|uniref:FUSC family protein n=1 Tax=Nocardioides koreensis TaxID=433651 RepID=A0ABN3A3Q2_9ACTN
MALRAGVSVLVPLLVLWAIDQQQWSIYAAFGAFTSLYGRNHVHLSRTRMQLTLAVLLTLATTAGVVVGLSAHRAWLAVPATALVAVGGSLVSDAQDWHPPGPLFLVFAFAARASLPSEPADVLAAVLVAGASAGFSVLVGGAGAWWRHARARRAAGGQGASGPARSGPALRRASYGEVARRHALRNGLAVAIAGSLATAVGIGHPYWAMVSAVVPLAARDLGQQVTRGLHRVIGTGLGLGMAAVLFALDPRGLLLILVIVLLQVGAELLVGRNYALALVAVTPLALLMVHVVAPTPAGTLLWDRGLETLIGVVIGLAVGYLTRRPVAAPTEAGSSEGRRTGLGRSRRVI